MHHGHAHRPFHLKLHRLLKVVGDLRDPPPVLDDDVDADLQSAVCRHDVNASVDVLPAQQLRDPIPQAAGSHAADAVAPDGRVAGDRPHSRWKYLDAAPLPRLDQRRGALGSHRKAHGTIRVRGVVILNCRVTSISYSEGASWPSVARFAAKSRSTDI